MAKKLTIPDIWGLKEAGQKITMLTAYDYPTALMVDKAGIDMILVGDSLAMTMLGYSNTLPVTMEQMLHHTAAVTRGVERALVVADMPFMSYNVSGAQAVENGGRFLKEAGADAVKLEGGRVVEEQVRLLVNAGIPVMGHLGLTPQTAGQLGGFKVQGRGEEAARQLLEDARRLEEAGAFSIVLECIPRDLAREITAALRIPTIGIGAGPDTDGQVLVYHDLVGLFERFTPRFVKQYVNLREPIRQALEAYRDDVRAGRFPAEEHCFK